MLEKILNLTTGATLTDLGVLAAITSIIVQVLKQILPKSFPTKALTIIIGVIVGLTTAFIYYGFIFKALVIGVAIGNVTAFVAMNGFDSFKEIWNRFQVNDKNDNDGEG